MSFCRVYIQIQTDRYRNDGHFVVDSAMGELGRYPIVISIIMNVMKYWKHIAHSTTNNSPLRAAYEEAMQGNSLYKSGVFIKKILQLAGMRWEGSDPGRYNIEQIKRALLGSYEKYWGGKVSQTSESQGKLSTYRQVKQGLKYENYLSDVKVKKHRKALTDLRISSHRLQIERGRYTKPMTARENRVCTWCSGIEKVYVEDEQHFLLECKQLEGLREEAMEKIKTRVPNVGVLSTKDQFIFMLTAEGEVSQIVAEMCYDGFIERTKGRQQLESNKQGGQKELHREAVPPPPQGASTRR